MASDRSPKERATKKKKNTSKGKAAQAIAAAAGAAAAAKAIKSSKRKGVTAVIVVICFLVGIAVGFFGLSVVTKNDGFTMSGEDFVEVQMYEKYVDEGSKAVFLGKEYEVSVTYYYREDISHDAELCSSVDTSVNGFYYAVYKTDAFLYKNTDLIRTIEVTRVEDDEQAI